MTTYASCILALILEDNQDTVVFYDHSGIYKTKANIAEMIKNAETKYFSMLKDSKTVDMLVEKHNVINYNNIFAYIKNYTNDELIDLEKQDLDNLDQYQVKLSKAIVNQGGIDFLWYFNYKESSDEDDIVILKNSKGETLTVQTYRFKDEDLNYFKELKKVYNFIDEAMMRDYRIWRSIKDDEK